MSVGGCWVRGTASYGCSLERDWAATFAWRLLVHYWVQRRHQHHQFWTPVTRRRFNYRLHSGERPWPQLITHFPGTVSLYLWIQFGNLHHVLWDSESFLIHELWAWTIKTTLALGRGLERLKDLSASTLPQIQGSGVEILGPLIVGVL